LKEKILVVDDEADMVAFIRDALADEGYQVLVAYNGEEVFRQLEHKPDLILLDVMMPGMDGLEVCRAIRHRVACPIIFLSARVAEPDRIQGLAVGGDDYLLKPFSLRELKARIAAHLRREQRAELQKRKAILHYGDLTIDLSGYQVFYRDQPVPLTSREFDIVRLLALHPGQVFSREQIYEKVWGYDALGDAATVTEHVKKIRAKLARVAEDANYITTVWGVGYKWETQ
jgi:DNA-binding response OmpR family regulator